MKIAVDLGNSRLKWAQFDRHIWHTDQVSLVNGAEFGDLLSQHWGHLPKPELVVVANVAGKTRLRQLQEWSMESWAIAPNILESTSQQFGVINGYKDPSTLGSDRWAALIAAHHIVDGPVCIVDCGTAVTVDALSAEGEFIGGVILPGLRLMRDSLVTNTDGIRFSSGKDTTCFAHCTEDGVAAGTLFGLLGAIERVVQEYRNQLGKIMTVIVTGGDADIISSRLRLDFELVPDLVLKGLKFIADHIS